MSRVRSAKRTRCREWCWVSGKRSMTSRRGCASSRLRRRPVRAQPFALQRPQGAAQKAEHS